MDKAYIVPSTAGREPAVHCTEIAISESSYMPPSSCPEPIIDRDDVHHFEIWFPLDYSHGPKSTVICKTWRAAALELNYCKVAKELYYFPSDYKLVILAEGSKVINCPAGQQFVYAHHFEFGLRSPLDLVLVKILKAFNICLAQLTPLAVRNLIAYVWVGCYLGYLETLNLFRRLHWMRRNGSAEKGWWSLMRAKDKMTGYPKMTGLKGWQLSIT